MKVGEYKSIMKLSSSVSEDLINLKDKYKIKEKEIKPILNTIELEEAILTATFIEEE